MRHNKKFNHLGRTASHRKAMLANMAVSLIEHKRISTTLAKAKALKRYVEPIITKSKTDNTHSRRLVFKELQNKEAVTELFRNVSVKIANRPGGYTRILRTGFRLGDNAEMCIIELVDYNENMLKESKPKKSTRTRRSKKSSTTTTSTKETPVAETLKVEEKVTDKKTEDKKTVEAEKTTTEKEVEVKKSVEKEEVIKDKVDEKLNSDTE